MVSSNFDLSINWSILGGSMNPLLSLDVCSSAIATRLILSARFAKILGSAAEANPGVISSSNLS